MKLVDSEVTYQGTVTVEAVVDLVTGRITSVIVQDGDYIKWRDEIIFNGSVFTHHPRLREGDKILTDSDTAWPEFRLASRSG